MEGRFRRQRLRISRTKKKYFRCDFSGTSLIGEAKVSIGEKVVTSMAKYKYLALIIQSNREIKEDDIH